MLDPKSFPRPPLLERVAKHLLVKWPESMGGGVLADTKSAYWVLETYHAPAYYIPRSDITPSVLSSTTDRRTFCEWKGHASYFKIPRPDGNGAVENFAWTYENPSVERFKPIDGYVSFYAGTGEGDRLWECYVDGEKVEAQPGNFYGGWVTSDIKRENVKGAPGTTGW